MNDATLEKIIKINVAGGARSRLEIKAASIGDSPNEKLRERFNTAFESLKVSGAIKADGSGWFLTADVADDLSKITTDPIPPNLKAIPAAICHPE